MHSQKNQLYAEKNSTVPLVYLLLAVSGLSFCFFLGFPFDNHNESYLWVVFLSKATLGDTLTKQLTGGIESFRPLGMLNAWLGFRLTGNIYLQQILNWIFAAASFIVLFFAAGNRILYSVLSFITCACFFSGYIYLFHLHGVFYGPFQLYVAALTWIACKHRALSTRMLVITSVATLIICLYHTFALLIFCGFLAGYILQLINTGSKKEYLRLVIALVCTLVFAKLILQHKELKTVQALADGLIASYKMAEINKALSLVAALLAALAASSLAKSMARMVTAAGVTLLLSLLLIYFQLPVLLLWVLVCAVKMMLEKNWVLAGLIGSAAILPLGSGSGSPTYVIFVLMICTFLTAVNSNLFIPDTILPRRISLTAMVLLFVCLLALKNGVKIPLASGIARPILAEQEKTKQFKNILTWKLQNKEYETYSLALADSGGVPTESKNAIARANRPVTDQPGTDAYLDFFSGGVPNANRSPVLYVTFGDKILENKKLIYYVNGTWNGKACVFR